MFKKTLLLTAALALSGCSSTPSSSRHAVSSPSEEAGFSTMPHDEWWYHSTASRANNISWAFALGFFKETRAPQGVKVESNGSLLYDSAVWTGNFHSAAGSSFLPGTSSWGTAAAWGIGLNFMASVLAGLDDYRSDTVLMGYLPKEKAADVYEARRLMVEEFSAALQKALKAQYPDAEFFIERDEDTDDTAYEYRLEIKSPKLNCKFGSESSWNDFSNPCAIEMRAVDFKVSPGKTSEMFGEKFEAWRFFAGGIKLHFSGGRDESQGLDWAKSIAAAAPFMPDYQYLYVTTMDGPNPKREKNPPFIVEKNRVNFFVYPRVSQ